MTEKKRDHRLSAEWHSLSMLLVLKLIILLNRAGDHTIKLTHFSHASVFWIDMTTDHILHAVVVWLYRSLTTCNVGSFIKHLQCFAIITL